MNYLRPFVARILTRHDSRRDLGEEYRQRGSQLLFPPAKVSRHHKASIGNADGAKFRRDGMRL
jgi:hypothetical protein